MNCTIHNAPMVMKESKTKFNQDGSPKTYFCHFVGSEICFGAKTETKPAPKALIDEAWDLSNKMNGVKPEPDWDAKDRQSMAQTAMKSASEIVAAQINAGIINTTTIDVTELVKDMANGFYKELIKMKNTST